MQILRVAPLAQLPRGIPQILDYYWATPLPAGALVRIRMGRRALMAVVLESLDIARAKQALRSANFTLKKIESVITAEPQLTNQQLALAEWISTHYASGFASALNALVPPFIGKRNAIWSPPTAAPRSVATPPATFVLTQPDTALGTIRDCIASADEGQIAILVPDARIAHAIAAQLAPHDVLVYTSALKPAAHRAAYQRIGNGEQRIIIGTRSLLFAPFLRLTQLIVEDPHHEFYKNETNPRYASSDVARQLAALHGAALTFLSPSLGTIPAYLEQRKALTIRHAKPHWPQVQHIAMDTERNTGNRSLFARDTTEAILDSYEHRTPLLVLSGRRGYASLITCTRCRAPFLCATCAMPMRLHRTSEDMAVCYHCTAYQSVPRQCAACHGPLKPSGVAGSQRIAEAISATLDRYGHPAERIPILDTDLTRSAADEQEVWRQFDAMERPMLVATQIIFGSRYRRTFDAIIVPSIDALTVSADFRGDERLVGTLEKLADFSPRHMILQSLHEHPVLLRARDRSWESFYSDEIADRKAMHWPPFCRLITLSTSHRQRATAVRQANLARETLTRAIAHEAFPHTEVLGPITPVDASARGQWRQNLLIKTTLAPQQLRKLLAYVPPTCTVDVDPRSIA